MFEVSFDLSAFDNLIQKKLEFMPNHEIAKVVLNSFEDDFKEEGRPDKWAERKDPGDGHPIGTDQGWLRQSFIYDVLSTDTEIEIDFSSTLPYANRFSFGFQGSDWLGREVDQPARPFWLLQDEDRTAIEDIIAKHFV